jgi:hypothetical protein
MNKLLLKISLKSRKKKYEQFMEIMKPKKDSSILDVGFSESEYMEGANYLEKYYPYPEQITALGINKPVKFLERYPKVKQLSTMEEYFHSMINLSTYAGQMLYWSMSEIENFNCSLYKK